MRASADVPTRVWLEGGKAGRGGLGLTEGNGDAVEWNTVLGVGF